jgi:O-antigen ligase
LITQKQHYGLFLFLTGVYFLCGAYLLFSGQELWALAIPGALLFAYMGMFHLNLMIWSVVLFTPVSIGLDELDGGFGLSLPAEPILAGAFVVIIIKQLHYSHIPAKVMYHPISVILLLQLFWMTFTSVTSEMPDVSFKAVVARAWFIVVMCFGTVMLHRSHLRNIRYFTWLYVVPLCIVIVYASMRIISYGLDKQMAHFSMQPFYNDHAVYAACIALFVPLITGFAFSRKYSGSYRVLSTFILLVMITGIILSYTRAAWLSIAVAIGVFVILRFRIHIRYVLLGMAVALIVAASMYDAIMLDLKRNKTDSSDNISEHVQSMSNISTDASNLERINRWNSALRMFEKKPVTGWGPGTYAFQYAPFQHSSELTVISTNAGNLGNAHSEYLGPLAESGIPGFLLSISLVVAVFWRCVSLYKQVEDDEVRMLVTAVFMGLITYFVHGVLNNYLDQDKAAVPFYGMLAIIIAIDLWHAKAKNKIEINSSQNVQ